MTEKTPTILQMEATECGATALAIVLAYYGKYISLATLREDCDVSRDGSKAINILKVARKYGLEADAYQAENIDDLMALPRPSILFWGFNHFVVFESSKGQLVQINDPALGHRTINLNTFNKQFTGVVLALKPSSHFKAGGTPVSFLSSIRTRVGSSLETLYFILLMGLALVVPGILIPGFSRIFIDDILIKETQSWLTPLLIGMGMTAIFRSLFTYLQQSLMMKWQTQRLALSTMHFIWHVLKLPLNFFSQRYTGDIQERITANERIIQWLSMGAMNSLLDLTTLIFYALVMLALSIKLGIIVIILLSINGTFLYFTLHFITDASYQFLQQRGRLMGYQISSLQRLETIKSRGAEATYFQRFASLHASVINSQQAISLISLGLQWFPKIILGLANTLLIGIGGILVMHGNLTLGTLVAMQSLFSTMQSPIQSLIGMANELPKIKGDFARIDDVLQHKVDIRYNEDNISESLRGEHPGQVSLKNVTFGYANLEPALVSDLSINIPSGTSISIVGITGSGKSTLAKLMSGLYQPWQGEILINGLSINNIDRNVLANTLAVVLPENSLMSGTIRDNLTMWSLGKGDKELIAALDKVEMTEVIQSRGGLDAAVLEGGANFSGGERQRLELAKAILQKPVILILDEATSSLSEDMQDRIFSRLIQESCTLVNISHRFNTIKKTNKIIVLDKGKILQQGVHDDLIKTDGLYKSLYEVELLRGDNDK